VRLVGNRSAALPRQLGAKVRRTGSLTDATESVAWVNTVYVPAGQPAVETVKVQLPPAFAPSPSRASLAS
jgi:hypothetical protein